MIYLVIWIIFVLVFNVFDVYLHNKANYDFRKKRNFPGSGYYYYLKYGGR